MQLAEDYCATQGASHLALNVVGHNSVARRLYASAGFTEVAIVMSKDLGASVPADVRRNG